MPKKTITPLRYPGGKSQLFDYVAKILMDNDLQGCTYVEPFAGGSGLALELLTNGIVDKLVLNDYDPCIYSFWHAVLTQANRLIEKIEQAEITIDEWHRQKQVNLNQAEYDLIEIAFSTLFLNRTNRSGILKAGPIGGKKQEGKYLLDCRFNKKDIIERIERIVTYKDCVHFHNLDARVFIKRIVSRQEHPTFLFLDPPYYLKGPGLYINSFTHEDHLELASLIKGVNKPWILTYDNHDNIRLMYQGENLREYNLNYSAQRAYEGTELMYFSNQLFYAD